MIYIIGLVEYGRATHKWIYHDYPDALHQLRLLSEVYQEVNEICPVFLKVGQSEVDLPLDTLLKQYTFIPKASADYYE